MKPTMIPPITQKMIQRGMNVIMQALHLMKTAGMAKIEPSKIMTAPRRVPAQPVAPIPRHTTPTRPVTMPMTTVHHMHLSRGFSFQCALEQQLTVTRARVEATGQALRAQQAALYVSS